MAALDQLSGVVDQLSAVHDQLWVIVDQLYQKYILFGESVGDDKL